MPADPSRLEEEPFVRIEYAGQQTYDEWLAELLYELAADGQDELLRSVARGDHPETYGVWEASLDPHTNFAEYLYLLGADSDKRAQRLETVLDNLPRPEIGDE